MKPFSGALVICDCDGVLFDSELANIGYYNAVLEVLGEPELGTEGRHHAHRLATPQMFEWVFAGKPERIADALRVARELDYTPFLGQLEPVAELFSTLRWLKERYRTAMATNRGATIPTMVEKFGLDAWFDLIVGTHDVNRPKPAPDMLLLCLEHAGVGPGQAVFVGDSPSDLAAARAAEIRFIAVGSQVEGDEHIEEFRHLPDVLIRAS